MLDVGHILAIGPVGYILRSLGLRFASMTTGGVLAGPLAKPTDSRWQAFWVDVDALYLADDLASASDIGAGVGVGEEFHRLSY
jgi:hypothetical protein